MITNPEWLKPKVKPYFHQLSPDCIEELVECIEQFNKDKLDYDTAFKIQKQILTDEIEDEEFFKYAIENISEMMGYIAQGYLNIRIHRDIISEVWFGVGCFRLSWWYFISASPLLPILYCFLSLGNCTCRWRSLFI